MLTLIRDGGWSMWFVLLFGFVALGTAAYFSARPSARHLGFIKWVGTAALFSVLAGFASDIGTTLYAAAQIDDANQRGRITTEGLAESMSPGVVGFTMLSLVALLTAVGRRRLDATGR